MTSSPHPFATCLPAELAGAVKVAKSVVPAAGGSISLESRDDVLVARGDGPVTLAAAYTDVASQAFSPLSVPASTLSQALGVLPSEGVSLTGCSDRALQSLTLSWSAGSMAILAVAAESPKRDEVAAGDCGITIQVEAAEFLRAIRFVGSSMLREDDASSMSSVCLSPSGKRLEVVSTDGRRLSLTEVPIKEGSARDRVRALLPASELGAWVAALEGCRGSDVVEVGIGDRELVLETDAVHLQTLRAASTFVPYEKVLDGAREICRLEVSREELLRVASCARVATDALSRAVLVTARDGSVEMLASGDQGESGSSCVAELIDGDLPSSGQEVHLNADYVRDGLRAHQAESVVVIVPPNAGSPLRLENQAGGRREVYVVMPVSPAGG